MNVVLLVVDSLRARSLWRDEERLPTPFFDRLDEQSVAFRRAYASECWTLPAHMSMFTGSLPSEHGAHFQNMAYTGRAPTIAEDLERGGLTTEVITRNSVFDGTLPGATRGFHHNTRPLGDLGGPSSLTALGFALAKPRMKRLIEGSGFFHALQKDSGEFLWTLARMGMPADGLALDHALERMAHHRRNETPYFLFLNLYDVHMPYPPREDSPLASFGSLEGWIENLTLPFVAPLVSSHAYLRPGFHLPESRRRMLLRRYHRAIALMDRKLELFHDSARSRGLLDDTMLIVTSDHGEAFGEHGLYCHDASVYEPNLHVPLWVHHPDLTPEIVHDVVTTRDLHGLARAVGLGHGVGNTILDARARMERPVALAEHFHYPHTEGLLPRYTQNIAAAIVGQRKLILGHDGAEMYDLACDPDENAPEAVTVGAFEEACRRDGAPRPAIVAASDHLRRWETTARAA